MVDGNNIFRFTSEAEIIISKLLNNAFDNVDSNENFAILMWNNVEFDENNKEFKSIPSFNLYVDNNKEKIIGKKYYNIQNRKVYIFFEDDRIDECKDNILDYREGKLILVHERDV